MRARWFLPLTLLTFIAAALPVGEAEAQKKKKPIPAAAKQQFKSGMKAMKDKRFADAVVAFTKAYKLTEDGLVMGQVAKAYEKAGDYKAAMKAIKVYRKSLPKRNRRAVNRMIRKYKRLVRKGKSKTLILPKEPEKKPVETKPVVVKPTVVKPVVPKPPVETKPVETKPVETKPVETKPVEPAPATQPAQTKPDDVQPDDGAGDIGDEEEQKDKRFYTWIAAGSAAALALSGLVVGLNAQSKYDELNDSCSPNCSEEQVDSVKTRALVADVLFGVAAAAAVTATVLYFLEGRPSAGEEASKSAGRRLNIAPVVGGGTYGLSADIRF